MKNKLFRFFSFLFITVSCYILYLTFISFRYQYIINNDIKSQNKSLTFDQVSNIPSIPNVGITTLPISALKAPYIISSDTKLAYDLLKSGNKENPYIFYSEYILSNYFLQLKMFDSAKFYAKKAFYNWPKNLDHYKLYNKTLIAKKDTLGLLDAYDYVNSTFLEKDGYAKEFIDSYSNAMLRFLIYEYSDMREINKKELLGDWQQIFEFETGRIQYLNKAIRFDSLYFYNQTSKYAYQISNDSILQLRFTTNNKLVSEIPIFYSDSLNTLILKNISMETNADDPKKQNQFFKKIEKK